MKNETILLGLLLALSTPLAAETLDYDYVYGSHQETDNGEQSSENDTLGGYWSFTERMHLFVSYGDAGFYAAGPDNNWESLAARLGAGTHWMLGENTMIAPELALVRVEYEVPDGAASPYAGATRTDTGYSAILELRHRFAPWLEVIGSGRYTKVFDNGSSQFIAGPVFHLNKHFAMGALYQTREGDAGWELTVRWYY